MISLEDIRCYCAVVEAGSFRAAAEQLHRSQPAISQRIRALETSLNEILLDRQTHRPTAAGRVLLERGTALLRAADDLQAELLAATGEGRGELRIGASDTNALYYLPDKVRAFARTTPAVRVLVHCRSSDQVADEVERGDLDLGIVTLPLRRPGLQTRPLFKQRLVLIVPRDHPLADRRRVRLDELHGRPMILMQQSTRTGRQIRDYFATKSFAPNIVMDSGSFEVIKEYVAAGMGISLIPEMALRDTDAERLVHLTIPRMPQVAIGATWRKNGYESQPARRFRELVIKA